MTQNWGIKYKRPELRLDLKPGTRKSISSDSHLPPYPEDTTQGKLICFVDATYGNDSTKSWSTTFTYYGGALVYRSKDQSIVALSSTKAELIAAVTAAKTARFLRSVLRELTFAQEGPTPIYEDNKSALDIVNFNKPSERS